MVVSKKETLLLVAKELFGQYGYAETTFKKISERAGVALGLLTHHYGNKEKLYLAAGLDVLDDFIANLARASSNTCTGYEGALAFCKAYLAYSEEPNSNWLVLVRCSPYSDMKTFSDREMMFSKFREVLKLLESQINRGLEDSSIRPVPIAETAKLILAFMVGVNRTKVFTPYFTPTLHGEAIAFVGRTLRVE